MIDEEATFKKYGYYSTDWKPESHKPIVAVCDDCGAIRYPGKRDYFDFCRSCCSKGERSTLFGKHPPAQSRKKMSESHEGKPLSKEHCASLSKQLEGKKRPPFTNEHRANMSKVRMGKKPTDDTRQKMSASHQGIPYEDWTGFVANGAYCEKFDEACRERIRAKYDNRCFICGKPQDENITKNGKQRELSVHHFDMNKDAGCNGNLWKLVPLCMCCHPQSHSKLWTARIEYLLNNVYNTTISWKPRC